MTHDPNIGSAFITGAGSGIGRAIALRLAKRGHDVGVFDLNADGLAETAHLISQAGATSVTITGDVSVSDDLAAAAARVRESLGPISVSVANAGIESTGTAVSASIEDWNRSVAVILTGTFLTARHTVPDLIETRGNFVAISSDCGVTGYPDSAPYLAAKHGVVGLVRGMAMDFGKFGVRSNAVAPGWVRTPMMTRLYGNDVDAIRDSERRNPMGTFATPEVIADVVSHLTSTEARHTNGHVYLVDGGDNAGHFVVG